MNIIFVCKYYWLTPLINVFVSLRKIGVVEVKISRMKVEEQPFKKWWDLKDMLIFIIHIAIEDVWQNKITVKVL